MKVFFKIIAYLLLLVTFFFVTAIGYTIYFLEANNGHLPSKVISRIERALNRISPEYNIFIGDAEAHWQGFNKPLKVTLYNAFIRRGQDTISSAPVINSEIDLQAIMHGHINFKYVSVESPEFIISDRLDTNQQQSQEVDVLNFYQSILIQFVKNISAENNNIPLEKLEIKNTTVHVSNLNRNFSWKIKYADLRFFELQNSFYLKSKIESKLLGKDTVLENEVRLTKNEFINFRTNFKNFPSKILVGLQPGLGWLDKFNSFTSGDADIIIDGNGNLSSMQVKSIIEFEDKNFINSQINFSATYIAKGEKSDPNITGKISIKDIPMNNLPRIWPETYGHDIRKDIVQNYTDGIYKNVEINFSFASDSPAFNTITDSKFSISGEISNASIKFYKNYPKLENLKGNFQYDGNNLDLFVQSASMGKSTFSESKIKILDLTNKDSTILEIEGNVEGGLDDLKPLLTAIFEGKDKNYFYNKFQIDSFAKTKFYYRDDIAKPFDTNLVKLDISSDITDVKINKIYKDLDLTSDSLKFRITEKLIELSGDSQISGSPANIDFTYSFSGDEAYNLKFAAEIPEQVIHDSAPDLKEYLKGPALVEINVVNKNKTDIITGKIDTTKMNINIPILSWKKEVNDFGNISFFGELKPDELTINDFQVIDKNSVSSGNAVFGLGKNTTEQINFTNLNFARNNANFTLERTQLNLEPQALGKKKIASAGNYIIDVKGTSFDLEDYIKNSSYSEQPFGVELNIKVNKAYLANGITLSDTNAKLKCLIEYCLSASATGRFDKGSVNLEYRPKTENIYGMRSFTLITDNAESFLSGLDVTNNVKGGQLVIASTVNEEGKQESKGDINLSDFKLSGTTILTRIISLASITGIIDLLEGQGLSFKKLKGSFEMQDHLVAIKDFRASGGSLGITAAGMLNFKDSTIDVSGAVTPAYTVNSIVGRVPVLGKVFTGKEGEGIIATKYNVKGKYADPDVDVNPLSLITPGFLRNIWEDSETDIDKAVANDNEIKKPLVKRKKR